MSYYSLILHCIQYTLFNIISSSTVVHPSACHLDSNNYMPTKSLRDCLTSLGGIGTRQIEYIDIGYGDENYLDNVCKAVNPNLVFDLDRTEAQPDACSSEAYMYPSHCHGGWLGDDCYNGCANPNFDGFYCTGTFK